jgi:hypothetical protein
MRKFLIATLAVVATLFFLVTEYEERVDTTASIVVVPRQSTRSGIIPVEVADQDLSNPLHIPARAAPGNPTPSPSAGTDGQQLIIEHNVPAITGPDERIAKLWQLADHNKAQLYAVLLQILESEESDDAVLREFIRATLEEIGHNTPGEILAALIRNATTLELRSSALRLAAEASQELSVDLFNLALDDPDPAIRRLARSFYDEISANTLLDAVADAVLDGEQAVRLVAFSTLEEMYRFAPVWEVAEMVLNDPDPKIRMRALELLTYGHQQLAIDRLALALDDSNTDIRALAQALLTELEQEPS